jgi:hypothetical protein
MSLARLWRGQRRVSHARKPLAPVYRRFTEGVSAPPISSPQSSPALASLSEEKQDLRQCSRSRSGASVTLSPRPRGRRAGVRAGRVGASTDWRWRARHGPGGTGAWVRLSELRCRQDTDDMSVVIENSHGRDGLVVRKMLNRVWEPSCQSLRIRAIDVVRTFPGGSVTQRTPMCRTPSERIIGAVLMSPRTSHAFIGQPPNHRFRS